MTACGIDLLGGASTPAAHSPTVKSDHGFPDLFRVMPDLVRHQLPELPAGRNANTPSAYRFQPVVLMQQAHSPDAVL